MKTFKEFCLTEAQSFKSDQRVVDYPNSRQIKIATKGKLVIDGEYKNKTWEEVETLIKSPTKNMTIDKINGWVSVNFTDGTEIGFD